MNKISALILFFLASTALAGLPPTTSKVSGDSNDKTTFKYQFPNFTGTHTGTTLSLGVNGVAGGGTGLSAVGTANYLLGTDNAGTGMEWKAILATAAGALTIPKFIALNRRDENGTASVTAMSSASTYVKLTSGGTPVTTINTIAAGSDGQKIEITNATGATVTVKDSSSAVGTAADRIVFPDGADFLLGPGMTLKAVYDTGQSRWVVTDTGRGRYIAVATQSIGSGGTITLTTTPGFKFIRVQSTGGSITTAYALFGSTGGWVDGTVVTLIGQSGTNTVTIRSDDSAKAPVLNGDCVLGQYNTLTLLYDASADRWIEIGRTI